MFSALNSTFVTPIDREDISQLASALDDVTDWIEDSARRTRLYGITERPEDDSTRWYQRPAVLAVVVLALTLTLNVIFF